MEVNEGSDTLKSNYKRANISIEAELFLETQSRKNSLLSKINNTVTPMGLRRLKEDLIKPPCDIHEITRRLDFVEKHKYSLELPEIQRILKLLPDTLRLKQDLGSVTTSKHSSSNYDEYDEWIPTKLAEYKKQVSTVDRLAYTCYAMTMLVQVLKESEISSSSVSSAILQVCETNLWRVFETALKNRVDLRHCHKTYQKHESILYLITTGIDDTLDFSKSIYRRNLSECQNLQISLAQKHNASAHIDPVLGYTLLFTSTPPPQSLVTLRVSKRGIICTTLSLQKLNYMVSDVYDQIVELTGRHCVNLLSQPGFISKSLEIVSKFEVLVGYLDLLISNTVYSKQSGHVRPYFGPNTYVINSLHPVLHSPIPNSYYLHSDLRFVIVTGENASGKSTYAKGLLYLQILSQIGCFIKADSAQFMIMDALFLINKSDCIIKLLNSHLTPSHVVIDELEASLVYQVALSEWILSKSTFCFYITHRHELVSLFNGHQLVNVVRFSGYRAESGSATRINALEIAKEYFSHNIWNEIRNIYSIFNTTLSVSDNSLIQAALVIRDGNQDLKKKVRDKLAE